MPVSLFSVDDSTYSNWHLTCSGFGVSFCAFPGSITA